MHRVPNPPKVPVIFATESRSRGTAKNTSSRTSRAILLLLAATVCSTTASSAAEPPADRENEHLVRRAAVSGNIAVHGASPARGRLIRDHAENLRREAFHKLLGEPDPQPWHTRCEIHVHASADSFAQAVGGPPVDARGATSLEFSGERVSMRRIDVMGDGSAVIPDALDHELVHVILADHFIHAAAPRWADEGLALLFDSPDKQRAHEADFQDARRRGLAWSTSELVTMEEYPGDAARQRVFYGQSAALVRWLIARHDPPTFIRFLDDTASIGIDAALDRHYALGSLASLTSAWKEVAPIDSLGLSDVRR